MSLLTIKNFSKALGATEIFDNTELSIEEYNRIALIGQNGSGKTTLLNIIAGLEDFDGEVYKEDFTIGYVKQFAPESSAPVEEVLLGPPEEWGDKLGKAKKWFSQLNLPERLLSQPFNNCSGGEKAKIMLIRILVQDADLLLLDEPTNHLDLEGIKFLQDWLNNEFQGTFIIISHDRFFISKTASKIIEIENKQIIIFNEDYDSYINTKQRLFEEAEHQYESAKSEKKRLKESLTEKQRWSEKTHKKKRDLREKYGGDTQYHIRLKKLEKSQRKLGSSTSVLKQREQTIPAEKPRNYIEYIKLEFDHDPPYKEVLRIKDSKKSIKNHTLFSDLSLEVDSGDKIFIIGANGSGKTSFLNCIAGISKFDSGTKEVGKNVKISYIKQELEYPKKKIVDYLTKKYQLDQGTVRDYLAKCLFRKDEVNKNLANLSGGELMRIALLEAVLEKANLIILDEPTNNLDIQSIEVLEEALNRFTGTLIVVSHDRQLIKNTADKLFELSQEGLRRVVITSFS